MRNQVLLSKLLLLRSKGYNLIPLRGGTIGSPEFKRPLISWQEYQKRRSTVEEIRSWAKQTSTFGIVTGPISNTFVWDKDTKAQVVPTEKQDCNAICETQKGQHHFFKWSPSLNSKITTGTRIYEETDVRGDGGYVVLWCADLPPVAALKEPPKWLVDVLPNKQQEHQVLGSGPSAIAKLATAEEGNRNHYFFRAAASLRDKGCKPEEIYTLLKPKSDELQFPDDELRILCGSAGKYTPTKVQEETKASSIEEFLKEQEKVEWICDGLIAKKSIGFVVGLPESGKTWMLIDLAIQCARGGQWLGKFPVEKAKVLFVDQERFKGETQRRFKAVIGATVSDFEDLKDSLFIRCGTTTRLNLQPSFDAFRKELSELRPDIVIIDSLATFHTAEENNRKDIQVVLERVKELRNEFGCTFLFISHENKFAFDKEAGDPSIAQMAGSIAIPAAAETVITVRRHDSESSMAYHTKSTMASTHEPFLLKVIDQNPEKTKIKVQAF